MYDPITRLFNRQRFLDILEAELKEAVEHRIPLALLIVDIRQFRRINRLYGHDAGDTVLRRVSGILKEVMREQDQAARIGDDQFALILPGIMNDGHAQMAAYKIQRLLDIKIVHCSECIHCGATIGIALYPDNANSPGILLKEAEAALDYAKRIEQDIGVATKHDDISIQKTWDIEVELGDAIQRSELRVFFQPKISLRTGLPIGAEALVRWQSPSRGLLAPGVFLPVAESIGFLKPLTEWMLNSALRLSNQWTTKWGRMEVSVNIPPRIIGQPDFTDIILSAQKLWRPDNVTLVLEILEQTFMDDPASSSAKLKELRTHDIGISIDDFGTGYSSLACFRDMPADELKIDRSFISALLEDKASADIAALIISLAHSFGLSVVAEGVEDIETQDVLQHLHCDVVQGYLYARPLPSDEFATWLKQFGGLTVTDTKRILP